MTEEQAACSRKYQTTKTNYNSSVYDLYVDYDSIPANHTLTNKTDFQIVLTRTLPATRKGFFKLKTNPSTSFYQITDSCTLNYTKITNTYNYDYFHNINVLNRDENNYIQNALSTNPTLDITTGSNHIWTSSSNITYNLKDENGNVLTTFTENLDLTKYWGNLQKLVLEMVIGATATFEKIEIGNEINEQL